jgi:glutaredoxin
MSKVLLFSTPTCSWCRRAKRYFKDRGVPFKEIITSSSQVTTPSLRLRVLLGAGRTEPRFEQVG